MNTGNDNMVKDPDINNINLVDFRATSRVVGKICLLSLIKMKAMHIPGNANNIVMKDIHLHWTGKF